MTSKLRGTLLLMLLPALFAAPLSAEQSPEIPERAVCAVCARRGATHGEEPVAASRVHDGTLYTFCSTACGEAFDQMPEGYAEPVLPRPAPDLTLTDLDGAAHAVAAGEARATLVDFWATWCAPCLEMMPTLSRLHEELGPAGFRVVGVSIDEERKKLERFLRDRAPAYPIVHDDGDDPAWWRFRVPAVPATFLIDADGQVVAQWSADFSEERLREAVEPLLSTAKSEGDR